MTHSREITFTLHKLVFLMDKIGDQSLQKNVNITFSQFRILLAINHKENLSQRDIAEFWDMTQAAVSRQVEILIKKKLVTRKDNKDNRREHVLNLTVEGENLLTKASVALDTEYHSVYKVISEEEQSIMSRNLDKLLQTICNGKTHSFCSDNNSKKETI